MHIVCKKMYTRVRNMCTLVYKIGVHVYAFTCTHITLLSSVHMIYTKYVHTSMKYVYTSVKNKYARVRIGVHIYTCVQDKCTCVKNVST